MGGQCAACPEGLVNDKLGSQVLRCWKIFEGTAHGTKYGVKNSKMPYRETINLIPYVEFPCR